MNAFPAMAGGCDRIRLRPWSWSGRGQIHRPRQGMARPDRDGTPSGFLLHGCAWASSTRVAAARQPFPGIQKPLGLWGTEPMAPSTWLAAMRQPFAGIQKRFGLWGTLTTAHENLVTLNTSQRWMTLCCVPTAHRTLAKGCRAAATLVRKSAATSSLEEPQRGSVPAHAASFPTAPILTTPFKIRHG